jgi:hypothetical protein
MSRIDNTFTSQQLGRVGAAPTAAEAGRRAEAAAPQPAVLHTPSPELQQALAHLRTLPEVRSDAVQQATLRLQSGELLTPDAAARTAAVLQGNLEPAAPEGAAGPTPEAAPTAAAPAEADAATQTPTGPDLFQLLDALRQVPLLRQEVVAEVAQRLASGQLTTPAATDQTVQAIMATTGRSG